MSSNKQNGLCNEKMSFKDEIMRKHSKQQRKHYMEQSRVVAAGRVESSRY